MSASIDTSSSPPLTAARDMAKALSDVGRLRIVAALHGRELCVCHLVELLGLDPSNVSRHVSILRRAGLVAVRKEGRWLHCRRADPRAQIWKAVDLLLAGAPEIERDQVVLEDLSSC